MKRILPAIIFLLNIAGMNNVFAQAPKITYSTPQVFTAGTAITPLSPTNTGGTVPLGLYGYTSIFAGSGAAGLTNGTGTAATFNSPSGIAIDHSGNIYLDDLHGSDIRKITPAGVVTTFAGSGTAGFANGTGTAASFSNPGGIAIDASGNLYVADPGNSMVRKITPAGVVTTFASGLNYPADVAVDAAGNVYEAEGGGSTINKITPAGVVTTFASGFEGPFGIAVSATGFVYVSDYTMRIFKVSPAGVVTVLAGSGATGAANGAGTIASFNNPNCLKVDAAGNVYVSDTNNNLVRKISAAGVVTTLAGSGVGAETIGAGTAAALNSPYGLALDASNNVYVTDAGGNTVRKIINVGFGISPALSKGLAISTAGIISGTPTVGHPTTIYTVTASNTSGYSTSNLSISVNGSPIITYASPQTYVTGKAIATLTPVSTGGTVPAVLYGTTTTFAGSLTTGAANGTGTAATFNHPFGAVTDNLGNVYIADQNNNLIRKITTAGVVTTFAGSGAAGSANGTGTSASFNAPYGLAADSTNNIYVADFGNNLIRKITPAGVVTSVAGAFTKPVDVAVDRYGNIYAVDKADNLIQKLAPGGSLTSFGSGFVQPDGIAVDPSGNVYVADASNRIFKVTNAGAVSVFAGSGTAGATNGAPLSATFNNPGSLKIDAIGNVYISDAGNNVIRKINQGVVYTLAGTGTAGSANGTGILASFNGPAGIAIDASDNLYVADAGNNQIRKIIDVGFGVSPALPKGLYINSLGVIGGIPTAAAVTKTYQVTAYNTSGRGIAVVSITVNGPPVIKYATPQVYTTGVTIPGLSPTNTGGPVVAGTIGQVSAFVGTTAAGALNGTGTAASFNGPLGMAEDPSGNIYVADQLNNLIRKITPVGVVTTLAGNGTQGATNGIGTAASFNHPTGLGVDQSGNVFVADQNNNLIRKITPAGVVTTFAGSGSAGFANGTGAAASFYLPTSIALDPANNLYVTDLLNNVIRKITQGGVVTTFAGSGSVGSANGTGTAASFHYPTGIAVDGAYNVYVTDQLNNEIRKITVGGVVSTVAGNGTAGSADGAGAAATFYNPYAVAVDGSGNLFVADYNNNEIRMITAAGVVSTLAGTTSAGSANGVGASASFNHPAGVVLDGNGNLFESDYYGNEIRTITISGYTISPALPAGLGFNTATGQITGTPVVVTPATIFNIIAYNGGGSNTTALKVTVNQGLKAPAISYTSPHTYVAGTAIASLTPANSGGAVPATNYGQVTTLAGGGSAGATNGTGAAASFKTPFGVAVDATGNVYIADDANNLIRKITAAGVVTTFAGSGIAGNANGTGTGASFYYPKGIAVDAAGNVYVGDSGNNLIRKITPAGVVATLAGSGVSGASNGIGASASFSNPAGVAVDNSGNVYVADADNQLIRKITPAGVVSTVAGSGAVGSVNATGINASFNEPSGISVSASGTIYVADTNNNLIRSISPAGVVTTLAGSGAVGTSNGTGTSASFTYPCGVTVDDAGNIYVTDSSFKLREITPAGMVTALAGSGNFGSSDGIGLAASFGGVFGVAATNTGIVYVTDGSNDLIKKVVTTGYSINPTLPAGLNFNAATGVISGTPAIAAADTNYVITAYNIAGRGTATLNITVNAIPAPVFSYASPQTYTEGIAIAALTPKNTGGAVPATIYGQVSTFAGSGTAGSTNGTGTAASFNGPGDLAVDGSGNIYVADRSNNLIRKITSAGVVTTFAGSGTVGSADGTGTAASFSAPKGLGVDLAGNIFVADSHNNLVRKITPAGVVSTFASGFSLPEDVAVDNSGNVYEVGVGDGNLNKITSSGVVSLLASGFTSPFGVAVDASGNVYVSDFSNRISKVSPAGVVAILAGSGTAGSANGTGAAASFSGPGCLKVDAAGNVYVADSGNALIRKISPAGVVTTLAGNGAAVTTDGIGTSASFNNPYGLALDASNNIYVTEFSGDVVRKIYNTGYSVSPALPAGLAFASTTGTISGTPTAVSGATTYTVFASNAGGTSSAGVTIGVLNSLSASSSPNIYTVGHVPAYGLARDAAGNLYAAWENENIIYKIDAATQAKTVIAGTGVAGYSGDGGLATSAQLNLGLSGLAVDAAGNVYIGDYNNNRVRKVDATTHIITTIAGTGVAGNSGNGGLATAAQLNGPGGVAVDASNNIYISDENNGQILKIDATTKNISTVVTGLGYVERIVFDSSGNLVFGDEGTLNVKKYNISTSTLTVVAGAGSFGNSGDGGPATAAQFQAPMSVVVDAAGNIYVADQNTYTIRKIDATTQKISTYAGTGAEGFTGDGGSAILAQMGFLTDLIIDNSGYLYVGDNGNGVIRKIGGTTPPLGSAPNVTYAGPQVYTSGAAIASLSPSNTGGSIPAQNYATVTTLAGSGSSGAVNGTGTAASFNAPSGCVTDALGNIYVSDQSGNLIRKISPAGVVSTFAGSGVSGNADGTGTAASFNGPANLAIDGTGNIYVADVYNCDIRKISPSGVVTTFAGTGSPGFVNGTGTAASFYYPQGVTVDTHSNIYVTDAGNQVIRKITYAGVVTTFAGSGSYGYAAGTGTAASFAQPVGITADNNGNVYIADQGNSMIRKITPDGVVTIFAGRLDLNGDGRGDQTIFRNPTGITIDSFGVIYVTDDNLIKRVTADGNVIIIAGNFSSYGAVNGQGSAATFSTLFGVSADAFNNLYIADRGNQLVRKLTLLGYGINPALPAGLAFDGTTGIISGTPATVTPAATYYIAAENVSGVNIIPLNISVDNPVATQAPAISYTGPQTYVAGTVISTLTPTNSGGAVPAATYAQVSTFAGTGAPGFTNGIGTSASFFSPAGMVTDASGNVYLADASNNVIRKITPGGLATTFAGSGVAGKANGTGTAATFNFPYAIAMDASGTLYVADANNNLIRKITSAGVVTTVAGSGAAGKINGTGTAATFNYPTGIGVDASGNIYVADQNNNLIRKITAAGVVTTLAGGGAGTATNGTGTAASFSGLFCLAIDKLNNIYVADANNNLIRKVTTAGVVTTLAGSGSAGLADGTGSAAIFSLPTAVGTDAAGNVYVGDENNRLVRKVTPAGVVTTLAGNGNSGAVDGIGASASFFNFSGMTVDATGDLYVSDGATNDIRKVNLTGYAVSPALLKGLSFDSSTGVIAGTPGAIIPATAFTITAYNTAGSGSAVLNITVNSATVNKPFIAYAGPQTYTNNTTITPLTPTNTGGAIPVTASVAASTFAGSGANGAVNGVGIGATFNLSQGNIAIDKNGNLYVADDQNFLIRKITPAGTVTTFAGSGTSGIVNGTGTAASFSSLHGITVDPSGNVFVSDNSLVRKITPAGVVTTFAGGGTSGLSVDGTGTAASFYFTIYGLASDASGNIYVAEPNDGKIRKISPAGVVSTIIFDQNNQSLRLIFGLTVDSSGNIYGACSYSNTVIKVTPAGAFSIFAGALYSAGSQNGPAASSTFTYPYGIAIDASGNLFVADIGTNTIREINTSNVVSTYAGIGTGGLANLTASASAFNYPQNLAIDANGNLYVFDAINNMIRKVGATGYSISPALPAGLVINANTGVISGKPTVASPATTYTITGYNSGGTARTTLNITVAASGIAPLKTQTYGAPDFSPATLVNDDVSYSSGNPAVATIVSGKIHITGVGATTITALVNGTEQKQTLKVIPAQLTIDINNQVKEPGSSIPALTLNYRGFVNGETEDVLTAKPIVKTEANENSAAGEYLIRADGAVAANYEITYLTGHLTVKPLNGSNLVTKTGVNDDNSHIGIVNDPNVKEGVSPNGDGMNDVLVIDNIANFPDNKLVLMSRNGTKVFEAQHYDNANHPFDGHSSVNGKLQPAGTYFYLLEYYDKGELKRKTGFFVLKY